MTHYFVRRRSTREVRRLEAIDQHGVQHTVVERVSVLHQVGAGGQVFGSEHGLTSYYSATTGEVVVSLPDGSFRTKGDGHGLVLKIQSQE
jgi:hypothetical protein